MGMDSNLYVNLWAKHSPIIISQMKSLCDNETSTYKLSEYEFTSVGNRVKSGYSFAIKLVNGRVISNLSGSAVARDLKQVLLASKTVHSLIKKKNYIVRMNKQFVLIIKCNGACN